MSPRFIVYQDENHRKLLIFFSALLAYPHVLNKGDFGHVISLSLKVEWNDRSRNLTLSTLLAKVFTLKAHS